MNRAQQVTALLLEDEQAAVDFARQTGLTFNPVANIGAVRAASVPPELAQEFAALPRTWEFTDRRPESKTVGMTFYVPTGSSLEHILQRYSEKQKEWLTP